MGWTLKSIDAATATGPGAALVFDTPRIVLANLQTTWTGTPAGVFIRLEGSLDGVNWGWISGNAGPDTNGQISDFDVTFGPVLAIRANLTEINNASPVTVFVSVTEV